MQTNRGYLAVLWIQLTGKGCLELHIRQNRCS